MLQQKTLLSEAIHMFTQKVRADASLPLIPAENNYRGNHEKKPKKKTARGRLGKRAGNGFKLL